MLDVHAPLCAVKKRLKEKNISDEVSVIEDFGGRVCAGSVRKHFDEIENIEYNTKSVAFEPIQSGNLNFAIMYKVKKSQNKTVSTIMVSLNRGFGKIKLEELCAFFHLDNGVFHPNFLSRFAESIYEIDGENMTFTIFFDRENFSVSNMFILQKLLPSVAGTGDRSVSI
ncbi:hypothetical protein J2D73_08080 [Acetobacter sacchari]|uniref:Uncharacterized protein n=1 Tax=Acetobacter sacchari TaxID=2661687 RepID=A0ABS3LV16_9PROT|nr:hypothetical protein [Acetobacter sacchari]MBO1359751.1 hypothetical protein [Acetobacter sacchari]